MTDQTETEFMAEVEEMVNEFADRLHAAVDNNPELKEQIGVYALESVRMLTEISNRTPYDSQAIR